MAIEHMIRCSTPPDTKEVQTELQGDTTHALGRPKLESMIISRYRLENNKISL